MGKLRIMATYSHLIFDLDGTLINSKEGLLNSLNYMLRQMGLNLNGSDIVDQLIGPPIQSGLKNVLGFDDRQIDLGVRLFREYYGQRGMFEGQLYPGVIELLAELQAAGKKLYLATSKSDRFMVAVIRHFELDRYLDDYQGAGEGGKHTKAGIITQLLERNQLQPSERIVMIGDTKYDIVGGKANEISTIGVGYGFGDLNELISLQPDYFAEDMDDLTEYLLY